MSGEAPASDPPERPNLANWRSSRPTRPLSASSHMRLAADSTAAATAAWRAHRVPVPEAQQRPPPPPPAPCHIIQSPGERYSKETASLRSDGPISPSRYYQQRERSGADSTSPGYHDTLKMDAKTRLAKWRQQGQKSLRSPSPVREAPAYKSADPYHLHADDAVVPQPSAQLSHPSSWTSVPRSNTAKGGEQLQDPDGYKIRCGCLPYKHTDSSVQVLLVSSGTFANRWILPAGTLEDGEQQNLGGAAQRECKEEAGVTGQLYSANPIAVLRDEAKKSITAWFGIQVKEQLEDSNWEESGTRKRQWFSIPEAAQKLSWKGLQRVPELIAPYSRPQYTEVSQPGLVGTGSGLHSWIPAATSDETIAAIDAQDHSDASILSKRLLDAKANNVRKAKLYQTEMAQQCFQNPPRRRSVEDFCWTEAEQPAATAEKVEDHKKPTKIAGEISDDDWVPRQWEPPGKKISASTPKSADEQEEALPNQEEEKPVTHCSQPAVLTAQQQARAQVISEFQRLKQSGNLSPTEACLQALQACAQASGSNSPVLSRTNSRTTSPARERPSEIDASTNVGRGQLIISPDCASPTSPRSRPTPVQIEVVPVRVDVAETPEESMQVRMSRLEKTVQKLVGQLEERDETIETLRAELAKEKERVAF